MEQQLEQAKNQLKKNVSMIEGDAKKEWDRICVLRDKARDAVKKILPKKGIVFWNEKVVGDFADLLKKIYGEKRCDKNLYFQSLISSTPSNEKTEETNDFPNADSIEQLFNRVIEATAKVGNESDEDKKSSLLEKFLNQQKEQE